MSSPVHAVSVTGFSAGSAQSYEAGRPEWDLAHFREMLSLAGISASTPSAGGLFPAAPVLEVGSGTGKSTRMLLAALRELAPAGAAPNLICAEPSTGFADAMRELVSPAGVQRLLITPASDLSAVADGSVAAVFVAQALHWFSTDAASAEFARVLAPGGVLVACWNARDAARALEWMPAYEEVILSAYTPGTPAYFKRDWERHARRCALYKQPPRILQWPRASGGHVGDANTMLQAALSISEIARRPAEERADFERRLRAVIARAPRLPPADDGAERILMPMFCEVMVCEMAK